ncbi:oxygenase MpaB family protein [Robertkochia solimangrovi]|uniref:oxygenase MpaB family protein n=1 Tax=Robertkochia solimangrovi TaxID=2213046 RepID=UPI00117E69E2|nr:oxygenase MpaB family protein [Robertkochia solimangrovi]TRZ41587.1 DUF2236 domain-containing protein [Robertkochia solimangrovi]
MKPFVKYDSVVRKIWGKSDTVLFIFAGGAAEFALNKAVDWLYFTGKLPADPLGRLFSTVSYARKIVFAPEEEANRAIGRMRDIHRSVEANRGDVIPDWAYRDVLFMLIYYSIAAFELLERKLNPEEKEEVYNVFYRVGLGMGLRELPENYASWLSVRKQHLANDLAYSEYTDDLFLQYKKHLGNFRYRLLIEGQKLVVPEKVAILLRFKSYSMLIPAVPVYKLCKYLKMDKPIKSVLLPSDYKAQINELDIPTGKIL